VSFSTSHFFSALGRKGREAVDAAGRRRKLGRVSVHTCSLLAAVSVFGLASLICGQPDSLLRGKIPPPASGASVLAQQGRHLFAFLWISDASVMQLTSKIVPVVTPWPDNDVNLGLGVS
jgi:hypothetical protein